MEKQTIVIERGYHVVVDPDGCGCTIYIEVTRITGVTKTISPQGEVDMKWGPGGTNTPLFSYKVHTDLPGDRERRLAVPRTMEYRDMSEEDFPVWLERRIAKHYRHSATMTDEAIVMQTAADVAEVMTAIADYDARDTEEEKLFFPFPEGDGMVLQVAGSSVLIVTAG